MKNVSIALTFLLMTVQNGGAAEPTCLEKLRVCKEHWQLLGPQTLDQGACEKCRTKCLDAQKTCKDDLPNNLATANTYHLGCKQACKPSNLK